MTYHRHCLVRQYCLRQHRCIDSLCVRMVLYHHHHVLPHRHYPYSWRRRARILLFPAGRAFRRVSAATRHYLRCAAASTMQYEFFPPPICCIDSLSVRMVLMWCRNCVCGLGLWESTRGLWSSRRNFSRVEEILVEPLFMVGFFLISSVPKPAMYRYRKLRPSSSRGCSSYLIMSFFVNLLILSNHELSLSLSPNFFICANRFLPLARPLLSISASRAFWYTSTHNWFYFILLCLPLPILICFSYRCRLSFFSKFTTMLEKCLQWF